MKWSMRYITDIQPDTPWVGRNGRKVLEAVLAHAGDEVSKGLLSDLVRLAGWAVWTQEHMDEIMARLEELEEELTGIEATRLELEAEIEEKAQHISELEEQLEEKETQNENNSELL